MNPGSSPGFPGSRTLAGWSRQLAAWRPHSVLVAHLIVHRVEALVRVSRPHRLDRLSTLLLHLLGREPRQTIRISGVPDLLGELSPGPDIATPSVVRDVIGMLERAGLVARSDAGRSWVLTPTGRRAAEHGEYPRAEYERRLFPFLSTRPDREPIFFPLPPVPGPPWPANEPVSFDVETLQGSVRQAAEWKTAAGFPTDVEEVLVWPRESRLNGGAVPPAWQRVVIDRVQTFSTLVIRPGHPDDAGTEVRRTGPPASLLAFSVEPENWFLNSAQPVLTLTPDQAAGVADLTADPTPDAWRAAWADWCRTRNLPPDESESCEVRRAGLQLRVAAPPALVERLRASRSDALKGEAWVLAGEGRVRAAAQLHVAERSPLGTGEQAT